MQVPRGRFLPYIPADNKTWAADDVIRAINDDLAELLSAPASEFWATVRDDASLHVCLDTYLRHKRCVVRGVAWGFHAWGLCGGGEVAWVGWRGLQAAAVGDKPARPDAADTQGRLRTCGYDGFSFHGAW